MLGCAMKKSLLACAIVAAQLARDLGLTLTRVMAAGNSAPSQSNHVTLLEDLATWLWIARLPTTLPAGQWDHHLMRHLELCYHRGHVGACRLWTG